MDQYLSNVFSQASTYFLSGLVAAALFFIMVGIRDLSFNHHDGYLYVVLGLFFMGCHFFLLLNLPAFQGTDAGTVQNLSLVWHWLVTIFAPALIGLFLLIGLYNFVITQVKIGLTKIFFGLSLTTFLFWLGQSWAIDVKGVLTLLWTIVWFDVEMQTAK
jgi:hypothetical protein